MSNIKLSIYDIIATLVPGIYWTWITWELEKLLPIKLFQLSLGSLNPTIQVGVILVLTYIAGHILLSFANYTIDLLPSGGYPPQTYFDIDFFQDFSEEMQNSLLAKITAKFNIKPLKKNTKEERINIIKGAYWSCYTVVLSSNPDTLAQVFLSHSGFYKSLTLASFLISAEYVVCGFIYSINTLFFIAGISIILSLLFHARMKRFKRYLTRTIYSEFLAN